MKKKFKQFLNEVDHSDIDPYNEEIWEDEDLVGKYHHIIKDMGANPTSIEAYSDCDGFNFTVDYPHIGLINFSIEVSNESESDVYLTMYSPKYSKTKLNKPEEKHILETIEKLISKKFKK